MIMGGLLYWNMGNLPVAMPLPSPEAYDFL